MIDDALRSLLPKDEGKPVEKPAEAALRQRMCLIFSSLAILVNKGPIYGPLLVAENVWCDPPPLTQSLDSVHTSSLTTTFPSYRSSAFHPFSVISQAA